MKRTILTSALAMGCMALIFIAPINLAQTQAQATAQPPATQPMMTPAATKALREIHGVKLNMPRLAVNDLLGKPKQATKQTDEFKLAGGDMLTVRYDPQGKVRVVQFYCTDIKRAPAWADVIGDTPIQTKPNGSKFARKVVNAEKFWVTMFQAKTGNLTTITLSRQTY